MSLRGRILDWATAIVVAIGIVAAIPMLPIIVIGWVVLIVRSPVGGTRTIWATRAAADRAAPGKLEGFSGAVLFPMVIAGWFLIALVAFSLMIGDGAQARIDHPDTILALVVFLGLLIGPTFLAYRSMHPEVARAPFSEWLGRGSARVAVPLVTWIACCWLAWSITTWTTFVGGSWTIFCTFVLACLVLVLPGVFFLIKPRGGDRLYSFVGVATVLGLVSLGAYYAGLTPEPRWP